MGGARGDARLPTVGAHEDGVLLVEDEDAVLLPELPHAAALRNGLLDGGLAGIEDVESDLVGV